MAVWLKVDASQEQNFLLPRGGELLNPYLADNAAGLGTVGKGSQHHDLSRDVRARDSLVSTYHRDKSQVSIRRLDLL